MEKYIRVTPQEGFRLEITNGKHVIISDQPSGRGSDKGMQPVELFVASLAACIAVYAIPFLKRRGVDEKNLEVEASYEYGDHPPRIKKIFVRIKAPYRLEDKEKKALQRVVNHCTVHNSIVHTPDIAIHIE